MFLRTVLIGLASLFAVSNGFADTLRCDSASVSVQGEVRSHYLRMGRSDFQGDFVVVFYDHRRIASISRIAVADGVRQDDRWSLAAFGTDSQGRQFELKLVSDEPSTIRFAESNVEFVPHCESWPSEVEKSSPVSCRSNSTLGLNCSLVRGQCVCHQHNGH
jgi:hypothetical protein